MKKLTFAIAILYLFFSCKKETTNTTTSNTVNNPNSVSCGDNPNINFSAAGTPLGKFSDCIKDIDGNVYKTVTIGTQTWMAENLKTSKYNDGTSIPNIKDSLEWIKLTTGAWCYYNNDEKNNAKYGKLYNWYTVSPTTNGNKNVCPTGWHVPTDTEWTGLTDYLGGLTRAGGKMKEVGITSWYSPNTDATNASLFTGLPGGYRVHDGGCKYIGSYGNWWSSTESTDDSTDYAWHRNLKCYSGNAYRENYSFKKYGLSVRCLRD
jgi:uncharacterized protein (TIGR02145 family)